VSGHAAAAPPTTLMKSRRFMSAMVFSLRPHAASNLAGRPGSPHSACP
jgi:hypothetical protein